MNSSTYSLALVLITKWRCRYAKHIALSDEELELLITGLHCVDERSYNFYTTTYTPWSEAKELKENLRIKLKRVLLNV